MRGLLLAVVVIFFLPFALRAQDYDDDDSESNFMVPVLMNNERHIEKVPWGVAYGETLKNKADFVKELADARKAYWNAYPNGPDLAAAQEKYESILNAKDLYYILVKDAGKLVDDDQPHNVMDPNSNGHQSISQAIDALSGEMEPVSPLAEDAYNKWIEAIRRKLGPYGALNIAGFPQAIAGTEAEHKKYVDRRDLAEYLTYCHTSPMHSTDPRQYFFFITLMDGEVRSNEAAEKLYNQLSAAVTPAILNDAVNQVRLKYADASDLNMFLVGDGLAEQLDAAVAHALATSSDDHLWALPFLTPRHVDERKFVDSWTKAAKAYDAMVARDGAAKVEAETHEAHQFENAELAKVTPGPDQTPWQALMQVQRYAIIDKFEELCRPVVTPSTGQVQPAFNFNEEPFLPDWYKRDISPQLSHCCEGSNGSIIGLRGGGDYKYLVRYDQATKQASVLTPINNKLIGGWTWHTEVMDLRYNGGWIYLLFPHALVRVREDGSQPQTMDDFADGSIDFNLPYLIGFDANGAALVLYNPGSNAMENSGAIYRELGTSREKICNGGPLNGTLHRAYVVDGNDLYFVEVIPNRGYAAVKADLATGKTTILRLSEATDRPISLMAGLNGTIYELVGTNNDGLGLALYAKKRNSMGFGFLSTIDPAYYRLFSTQNFTLTQCSDGYLYGIARRESGADQVMYRMNPDGTGFGPFYKFTDESVGLEADMALFAHSDGCLYGVGYDGGEAHAGTIFKIRPDSKAATFNPPDSGAVDLPSIPEAAPPADVSASKTSTASTRPAAAALAAPALSTVSPPPLSPLAARNAITKQQRDDLVALLKQGPLFTGTCVHKQGQTMPVDAELNWSDQTQQATGWVNFPALGAKKKVVGAVVNEQGLSILYLRETGYVEQSPGSTAPLGLVYRLALDNSSRDRQFRGSWMYRVYSGELILAPKAQ